MNIHLKNEKVSIYYTGLILFLLMFLYCSFTKILPNSIIDINGYFIVGDTDNTNVDYIKEDTARLIAYLGGIEFNGEKDALKTYLLEL
jgi:hypothetical protein